MPQGPSQSQNTVQIAKTTKLYVNAAGMIKVGPGVLRKLIVNAAGSTGSWTFNDLAAASGATVSNQIATLAYNATNLTVGMPVTYDARFTNGLYLSAVPTSGVCTLEFD